jgi:hypothetical protein
MATENKLHVRYLLTEKLEVMNQILFGNLSNFLIPNTMLVDNTITKFFRELIQNQGYRHNSIFYREFKDYAEYCIREPNHQKINNNTLYPCYDSERSTKIDEEKAIFKKLDAISKYLIQKKILTLKEMVQIKGYFEPCGTGSYWEKILIRPLYFNFLCVTNMSSQSLLFKQLNTNDKIFCQLPKVLIKPESSILIPLCVILTEHSGLDTIQEITINIEDKGSQVHELKHLSNNTFIFMNLPSQLESPNKVIFSQFDFPNDLEQGIHNFDCSNLYLIDSYWRAGSCPHVFFQMDDGLIYKGELFTENNKICTKVLVPPKNSKFIVIAELEDEETHIEFIMQNKKVLLQNHILNKNEDITIAIDFNQPIKIKGFYRLINGTTEIPNNWLKNTRVRSFLKSYF